MRAPLLTPRSGREYSIYKYTQITIVAFKKRSQTTTKMHYNHVGVTDASFVAKIISRVNLVNAVWEIKNRTI